MIELSITQEINNNMKIRIKHTILLVVLAIPLMSHGQIFTTSTYNLKGKVKNVESKTFETIERNGKIMEGSKSCCVYIDKFINASFTPQGLMETLTYDFDGDLINIGLKYNAKNQFVEKREWHSNGETKYLTAKFEYDSNGCFSKITQFFGTGENDYVTYTYKNNGKKNISHRIDDTYLDWDDFYGYEYEGSGDFPDDYWYHWYGNTGQGIELRFAHAADTNYRYVTCFEYDSKGNQIKQSPGTIMEGYSNYSYDYKYDNNGRRTYKKMSYVSKNDETDSIETRTHFEVLYTYDNQGRLAGKQTFVPWADSIMPQIILQIYYTSGGKRLEYLTTYNGTKDYYKTTTDYNMYGSLIRTQYTYPENTDGNTTYTQNYKYTYDEHGNWIKVLMYLNGNPYKIMNRKITYYE